MAFHLYSGNNLEKLAEEILCKKILTDPLSDPFKKDKIIVQSRGMAAWLKQQIAQHNKICANIEFPFLNNFINDILENTLKDSLKPDTIKFSREIMSWKIYNLLEEKIDLFPELYTYVKNDNKELKQFQLSEKIAETFDQYLIYRPEMMINWENSVVSDNDNLWQAKIWKELTKDLTSTAKGFHNFFNSNTISDIPHERIILFGISYMPLIFLDFFKKLGELGYLDVHFIYLNPSEDNWYFNLSDKMIDKYLSQSGSLKTLSEEELYLEEGNKLLSSYGQAGREFFGAVVNITEGNHTECFTEDKRTTILKIIQDDIFKNIDKTKTLPSDKKNIDDNDKSIKIHNCHNRTREVEVLYDNILNNIEKHQDMQPRDIIVMAPDISEYASTIKSIFDSKNKEQSFKKTILPYSLSDVNTAMHSKIIKSYFDILNLNFSKFKMTEIMDILETKAIYETFDIEDSELDYIRKWIIESGMRWGIDSEHRKNLNLPAFNQNSISSGFDRMLLGYSLEDNGEIYSDKIIPYDEIELSNSELLGKFSYFIQCLINVKELVDEPKTLSSWTLKLNQILDTFFADDNNTYRELVRIRKVIDNLAETEQLISFDKKISYDTIKYYLAQKAGNDKIFEGFLRGKITFCTMQPMRTVPAKLICLLGMNEGVFPREEKKAGFNIMEKNVRFCDKSKTLEDRFIFLESFLAAKTAFYVSYIGNDNKTNESSQPSIVVCELLDYIKLNFSSFTDRINNNERLHGFSEIYLNDSNNNYFTYSKSNLSAAQAMRNSSAKRLFAGITISTDFDMAGISLTDLISFFKNPCKYFITKSLRASYIINDSNIIEDCEPIEINPLDRYLINKEIVKAVVENKDTSLIYNRMEKESSIPIGNFGKIRFREQEKLVRTMFKKINKNFYNKSMEELIENTEQYNFDLTLDNTTISCELDFVKQESHQFFLDPGKYNGKRLLEAWLKHLALNCKFPASTYCLFRDSQKKDDCKAFLYNSIKTVTAKEKLTELIKIFKKGLTTPLPFFPISSFKYAESEKDKQEKAEKTFISTDFNQGEDSDFYTKLCYDKTLFNSKTFEEFAALSKTVFSYFWKGGDNG